MSIVLFVLLAIAQAEVNLTQWAQGEFVCEETVEEINQRRGRALEKTLAASNFLIRTVIDGKMEGKPDVCRRYQIQSNEDIMTVTCDDKPTVDIRLDGNPTIYPKPDNGTFGVVADVRGTIITQDFQGENGSIRVIYEFSAGRLLVTKIISSEYFGAPLRVDVAYHQK